MTDETQTTRIALVNEQILEAVGELEAAARKLVKGFGQIPDWVSEAGVHVPGTGELEHALERLRVLRLPASPPSLAGTPEWLIGYYPEAAARWNRLGEGPRAAVTDGRCLLIVDNAPEAPPAGRSWSASEAERAVDLISKTPPEHLCATVSVEALERWCLETVPFQESRFGLIGPAQMFEANRVRRWALAPAIAAGDANVLVWYSAKSDMEILRVDGSGWRSILMPVVHLARMGPQLIETAGGT